MNRKGREISVNQQLNFYCFEKNKKVEKKLFMNSIINTVICKRRSMVGVEGIFDKYIKNYSRVINYSQAPNRLKYLFTLHNVSIVVLCYS